MRVRFAPSPTGSLHVGSARTALFNFLAARHDDGSFVLRVEDTDAQRSEAALEAGILADLRWLGLAWDEGPDCGGPYGPYRQSERRELYLDEARRLVDAGHAYHCFCTQERLDELKAAAMAAGGTPRYDGRCRGLSGGAVASRLAAGERAALRFVVPEGEVVIDDVIRGPVTIGSDAMGDFIIVRSDGMASYNFAAAVDDRAMRITHVIRGDDHLSNTARQLLVGRALGAPHEQLPRYAHHALILGTDGGKLSKRHGSTSVGDYRAEGYLPEAIVNYLALLSWSHGEDEVLSVDRLVAEFALEKLSSSPAVFDRDKLDWIDHQWIMAAPDDAHERRVAERLPAGTPPQAAAALATALKPSLERYGQVAEAAAPVLERPDLATLSAADPELPTEMLVAAAALAAFRHLRASAGAWLSPDAARELVSTYRVEAKGLGFGARQALMPLRIALTGCRHGPELPFVLAALERIETLARLDAVLDQSDPTAGGGGAGGPSAARPTKET